VSEDAAKGAALSTPEQLPKHYDKLKKLKGAFLAAWTAVELEKATKSDA